MKNYENTTQSKQLKKSNNATPKRSFLVQYLDLGQAYSTKKKNYTEKSKIPELLKDYTKKRK